ncbi:uncharacterized protein C8Q71DRAFT_751702 [Rhodofomes roseus]|uniref:SH3 domain-containing protein n=1 Tax=Rhodofomes roseus TaxID=34475 RepID=A0ABQ8KKA6_9APHY|nr:uncharacterized protein C8Q71DRAFT_751702 [Rhodofomes roseus]KAH9838531.1 hypothetical protein C8Q71DRAFT_751702 [Rhodofomes roseus]
MVPPSPVLLVRATNDPLGGGPPPPVSFRTEKAPFIGIAFAGALVIGCGIWLAIYFLKRRRKRRREREERADERKRIARKSLLTQVEEKADMTASPSPRPRETTKSKAVNRALVTASVVMPEKALTPRVGHQRQTSDFVVEAAQPAQPLPLPLPIMIQPPSPTVEEAPHLAQMQRSPSSIQTVPRSIPSRPGSSSRPVSFVSRSSPLRNSVNSRASSQSASASMFEEGQMRKVRQVFTRALPDELAVTLGEHLAILQRFDDNWCVVGRESRGRRGDVEFGAVPAWVFTRPEEGVRPIRPIRTSSLNVRISLEAPGGPSFAWTNT